MFSTHTLMEEDEYDLPYPQQSSQPPPKWDDEIPILMNEDTGSSSISNFHRIPEHHASNTPRPNFGGHKHSADSKCGTATREMSTPPQLWEEVIGRWESSTILHCSNISFANNQEKMSDHDLNYKKIVERVGSKYARPSIGLTGDSTEIGEVVQSDNKIIIRQNNVIIEQLIDIRQLLSVVVAQSSSQATPSWINDLTTRISNLSLGKEQKPLTTVYGGPHLVWKKPRDPKPYDKQLDVLHHKGTDLAPAEILYTHGLWETKMKITGLTRSQAGGQVILNLVDTRYSNDIQRAIIGTMEVDMARNSGVIYMAPKMQMTVTDFAKHFQLIIKTRGYEDFTEGQNLAITKILTGRLSNNTNNNFKLKIDRVMQYLGSQGIKAIEGKAFTAKDLAGKEWNITLPATQPLVPSRTSFWEHNNKSVGIRFSDYKTEGITEPESDDEHSNPMLVIMEENSDPLQLLCTHYPDYDWSQDFTEIPHPDDCHLLINIKYSGQYPKIFTNPFASECQRSVVGSSTTNITNITILLV
ncbi:hypothetical protein K1719_033363 [Acacia pycnantha]|nr:hypothetical protein K1719_033363 [Acacia pycnantha]